jgi:hypothetical protein
LLDFVELGLGLLAPDFFFAFGGGATRSFGLKLGGPAGAGGGIPPIIEGSIGGSGNGIIDSFGFFWFVWFRVRTGRRREVRIHHQQVSSCWVQLLLLVVRSRVEQESVSNRNLLLDALVQTRESLRLPVVTRLVHAFV